MILEFPIYRQLDAKDCGLSCLPYDRQVLWSCVLDPELTGESLHHTGRGLYARYQRGGGGDRVPDTGRADHGGGIGKECPLPCILHWNQWHFVVCYKIRKGKFYIADPAAGLITYTREEFKRCWVSTKVDGRDTGTALLLEPGPEFYGMEDEGRDRKRNLGFFFPIYIALQA